METINGAENNLVVRGFINNFPSIATFIPTMAIITFIVLTMHCAAVPLIRKEICFYWPIIIKRKPKFFLWEAMKFMS